MRIWKNTLLPTKPQPRPLTLAEWAPIYAEHFERYAQAVAANYVRWAHLPEYDPEQMGDLDRYSSSLNPQQREAIEERARSTSTPKPVVPVWNILDMQLTANDWWQYPHGSLDLLRDPAPLFDPSSEEYKALRSVSRYLGTRTLNQDGGFAVPGGYGETWVPASTPRNVLGHPVGEQKTIPFHLDEERLNAPQHGIGNPAGARVFGALWAYGWITITSPGRWPREDRKRYATLTVPPALDDLPG